MSVGARVEIESRVLHILPTGKEKKVAGLVNQSAYIMHNDATNNPNSACILNHLAVSAYRPQIVVRKQS